MSADKSEAQRLADALRRCAPVDFDGDFSAAAALLERWPDGEPYCYVYEWDGAGPTTMERSIHRSFSPSPYNGCKPDRAIPVYTAPPAERIAALEREVEALRAELRHAPKKQYAAFVTDCEACLTPDACAIRGQCAYYLRTVEDGSKT